MSISEHTPPQIGVAKISIDDLSSLPDEDLFGHFADEDLCDDAKREFYLRHCQYVGTLASALCDSTRLDGTDFGDTDIGTINSDDIAQELWASMLENVPKYLRHIKQHPGVPFERFLAIRVLALSRGYKTKSRGNVIQLTWDVLLAPNCAGFMPLMTNAAIPNSQ